ncbi:short coiled-coil protein B-like isoform X1 [Watersipora subatra]|uniref:short coiled-coil protein B-like isoform X1 n=2 Tax=Watersipora subatra TaxID=2589382 RepID=UPI00355B2156
MELHHILIRSESIEFCYFVRLKAMSDEDLDPEMAQEVQEEKKHLIGQILDLQNTLDEFSSKVDTVKEENLKLKAENQVLGQYIESLMTASTMFQSTDN